MKIAVLGLVACLAVAGWLVYDHQTSPYHFEPVAPGVLYRSGLLRPEHLQDVLDEYGLRTVVSLIDQGSERDRVAEERRIVEDRGLQFVDLPMEPETPPTPEQLDRWLSLLADPERRPVLVHCKHGVVRTGMMVAAYQLEAAATDNEAVLQGLPMFGHDLDAPYRQPMRDFIRGYQPTGRLRGATSGVR